MAKTIVSECRNFLEELQPLFFTPHIFTREEIRGYHERLERLDKRYARVRGKLSKADSEDVRSMLSAIKELIRIDEDQMEAEQAPDESRFPNLLGY